MVMKGRSWIGGAVLSTAVLFAILAVTLSPKWSAARDPVGKATIGLRLGVGTFDLGDVNSGINRSNNRLESLEGSQEWKVPSRLHGGFSVSADANYDLSSQIRIGVTYGNMWGSTSVDYGQKISVRPRTTVIGPRAFWKLPWRFLDNTSLRLFAGPLFLRNTKTRVEHEDTSEEHHKVDKMTITGSGSGILGGVLAEYTMADRFTLSVEAGYQRAKSSFKSGTWSIEELRFPGLNDDDDTLLNDRDLAEDSYLWGFLRERYRANWNIDEPHVRTDLDTDFSGATLQAILRVYIF